MYIVTYVYMRMWDLGDVFFFYVGITWVVLVHRKIPLFAGILSDIGRAFDIMHNICLTDPPSVRLSTLSFLALIVPGHGGFDDGGLRLTK